MVATSAAPVELIVWLVRHERERTLPMASRGRDRDRLVIWLTTVLVDHHRMQEHLQLLAEEKGLSLECHALEVTCPTPERFAWREPWTGDRETTLLAQGPAVLADGDLVELALNPFALADLARLIEDTLPVYWMQVMDTLGRELQETPVVAAAEPTSTPLISSPRTPRRWLAWLGTLAAGVLVGTLVTGFYFQGGGRPGTIDLGTLTFDIRGAGADGPKGLTIQADVDGFAVIILLRPMRRPEIVPGSGGIRIHPNQAVTSPPLEPGPAGSVACVLITETPPDAIIRAFLRRKEIAPDQAGQLVRDLEAELRAANFRWVLSKIVPFTADASAPLP